MGFVKDAARGGLLGVAGLLGSKKRNKDKPLGPAPSMISNEPYERPMSLITPRRRGGY